MEKKNTYGLKNGYNYYQDGKKMNGKFSLSNFKLIKFLNSYIPYILIYRKNKFYFNLIKILIY